MKIGELKGVLNVQLRGRYNYYGITFNSRGILRRSWFERNRMREIHSYGSVGEWRGNKPLCPEKNS
ncbi:hypothetical protein DMA11_00655 [Marinilabiliaceae bacterium JC017]|nr:hypothetical protein DMA11_00655 [Marinilabiliaceae bacterium JC017]